MMKKKSIKRVTSAFLSAVMLLGCLMSVCAVNAGAAHGSQSGNPPCFAVS